MYEQRLLDGVGLDVRADNSTRAWSNGMTSRCGRASPGSTPGARKFFFAR